MYQVPAHSTAVNVPESMRFDKNAFVLNSSDKELVDYVMLPEGLIKSRTEALAQEIVTSWQH